MPPQVSLVKAKRAVLEQRDCEHLLNRCAHLATVADRVIMRLKNHGRDIDARKLETEIADFKRLAESMLRPT
jgi:predicted ATPase